MELQRKAKLMSPLTLAFIGDAVFELLVRELIVEDGSMPVKKLHDRAVGYVSCAAQAQGFARIEPLLSEDEHAMFTRGRNAHARPPRNADPGQYAKATGLECLFGYLYVAGERERIHELFTAGFVDR